MELDFIYKDSLRQRIEDSISYIYTLYEDSRDEQKNDTFRSETYRVIILYTVSIIEAVLHHIREQQNITLPKIIYKEKVELNSGYKNAKVGGRVVVAVEHEEVKSESEIGLRELVQSMTGKILTAQTTQRILKLLDVRNSVHLRRTRAQLCTIDDVEEALNLLAHTITHAPRHSKQRN